MVERIPLKVAFETEEAGSWADLPRLAHDDETSRLEDTSRFVLQRTAKGLWTIAVRGYNSGEPIPAVVAPPGELSVIYDDTAYGIFTRDSHARNRDVPQLHHLPGDEAEKYIEAMKQPDEPKGIVVEILEEEQPGVWLLSGPAEYNDYEDFARLAYRDADHLGLSWRSYDNYRQGINDFKEQEAARVVKMGPRFAVTLYQDGSPQLTACSITDRILPTNYPTLTTHVGDITDEEEAKLHYLPDQWTMDGTIPKDAPSREAPLSEKVFGFNGVVSS